jgi:hypothetical protein
MDIRETATTFGTSAITIVEIDAPSLLSAVKATSRAMSRDGTRPHLNALRVEWNGIGLLTLTATDGHRLHRTQIHSGIPAEDIRGSTDQGEWLIPENGVRALASLLTRKGRARKGPVEIVRLTFMGAHWGAGELSSEVFPPTDKVIPSAPEHKGETFIGIDPSYMADACDACRDLGAQMTIGRSGDVLDPLVIRATFHGAAGASDGNFLGLIMPRRI